MQKVMESETFSMYSHPGWLCQCWRYCERDADLYTRWALENRHEQPTSPTVSKSPRVTQGPTTLKSPKSQKSSPDLDRNIVGNDNNDNNGHMKRMTVV